MRTSVDYDKMTVDDKKKFDVAVNEQNINTVNQYVVSLSKKEEAKKTLTKLPNASLETVANATKREEEKKVSLQPSSELVQQIQSEVTILNEAYGPMVALARMIEY